MIMIHKLLKDFIILFHEVIIFGLSWQSYIIRYKDDHSIPSIEQIVFIVTHFGK